MPKYQMTISLGVIDHLGLNLYSSIPAVMSELVANAWDADADNVVVSINTTDQTIVIQDDGHGMSEADINAKFLKVGYRRRQEDPAVTEKGRHVMGRKGIGKLSIFSVAKHVDVHTAVRIGEDTERSALRMTTDGISEAIETSGGDYEPEELPRDAVDFDQGTRLVLSDLRKRVTAGTARALRRRLARRFSVIGAQTGFEVVIDGVRVGVEDRDYFSKIEYIWSIGAVADRYEALAVNAKKTSTIEGAIADDGNEVSGWVGTVESHGALAEGENGIAVLAWGKLIHENLLQDIKAGGLYTKYIIGELRADFLDSDAEPDIVTSDRQSLKEDDERVSMFRQWVEENVLRTVERSWGDWRREEAMEDARENEAIEEWYSELSPDNQMHAKRLFGKIGAFHLDDEEDRKELYRHTILAFERLRFHECLREIDALGDELTLDEFTRLFQTVDDLEAAEYHRIARVRLEVIRRLGELVDADAKERVIQELLFDHLWLLHPAWERASVDARMERRVEAVFEEVTESLTDEERAARIDIALRTAANKHIIIELKRYSARPQIMDLLKQLAKYKQAFEKCVAEHFADEHRPIEIIAILGTRPAGPPDDPQTQDRLLQEMGARWVSYDMLIAEALDSYKDYLEADERISRITELLDRL